MHRPGYVQSAACRVYAVPMVYQLQLTYAVGVLHKSFLMKDMGNYTRYYTKGRINVKKIVNDVELTCLEYMCRYSDGFTN